LQKISILNPESGFGHAVHASVRPAMSRQARGVHFSRASIRESS
jgi:hypothetical protein